MDGFRTRGQPVAVAAIRAMLGAGFPHALLLAGPGGVGKTTLALDIAAALLCTADDASSRPCRTCRGCRMVEHGNHPDVHRLAPLGAGALIPIGGREDRGVRDLVGELSLMPVEGGARVAIIERAERMTEDAQSALLKTLEEPPARTTIILCTDDEERVLPTIRSRSARVRLGPVAPREVEAILVAQGVADAPTAARLARITDGRPGYAIAYARAPEAVVVRAEIARTLLDLHRSGLTSRLAGVRELAVRASDMVRALDAGAARAALDGGAPSAGAVAGSRGRGRSRSAAGVLVAAAALARPSASNAGAAIPGASDESPGGDAEPVDEPAARVPAAERRRGALALLEIWRGVVRDLGLVVVGEPGAVRDQDLMDDLDAAAGAMSMTAIAAALGRLDVAAERLEGNVSPELVLDVLAIHWAPAGRR